MLLETGRSLAPAIHPGGISWRTVRGCLEVSIDLLNASAEPTEDAELVIEAAPLGAFVPFEPGTRIAVAGFEPWERRRVVARIPIEGLRGVTRMLALCTQVEIDRLVQAGEPGYEERIEELQGAMEALRDAEWAGNLNVYFDRAPEASVEVHRALDLKVEAGRRLLFMFVLPSPGAYRCEPVGSNPEWGAEVMRWMGPLLMVTAPAAVGRRASVEVRVTREADGRMVPVVFSFETIAGKSDRLGCVSV
ncbi:MAG TPA: hypothetical protein VJY35_00365 [Candidatus Eisenbacteria bacterium]|nr:hypothetical protein [Candidatus Eisenbacteria bacterium]